jgi:hypothetical protein
MESRTPALTRTEIDAMVDPKWLSLYYDLWGAGIIANDEAPEQWQAFGGAISALQVANHNAADEGRSSLLTMEEAGSDLANRLFEEGFKRGIALLVWLHGMLEEDKPEDDRAARTLTPTEWYVSGKLLDSALRK